MVSPLNDQRATVDEPATDMRLAQTRRPYKRRCESRHGVARNHGLFGLWRGIKQRCLNPKSKSYPYYGGRGITICDRWKNEFWAFVEDVGPRPSPKHSLDRYPNNDGNYEPGNVRWATAEQQVANRRRPKRRRPLPPEPASHVIDLRELVTRFERRVITRVLRRADYNIARAARQLSVTRPALYARIHRCSIPLEVEGRRK